MPKYGIYEWNAAKRTSNLAKHAVDFAEVENLDWDTALTIPHRRRGEVRHLTYAPVGDRLHALVWMERGDRIRVISFRRANAREIERYEKALAQADQG